MGQNELRRIPQEHPPCSQGFIKLGLSPTTPSCIYSFNCPEWFIQTLALFSLEASQQASIPQTRPPPMSTS
ncbi:AcylCoA synthetase bubblegum family member 2 [Caligus rogercresseyi]|uniref:AcylCoA synthetase bubblegum family member 2 n=1 Tax=Caligus rogercresseyi TaxID=217165 RepID=A0A7T8QW27_CALRO|nr:AcylCoA synthetase bubblegum family member 2 [Caligus rogercresseyi]